ncbi:MAG TPA: ornithine carbamoyltransferase [Candidatus Xenobia bacterium]|nr:ornithine carbamoyltransferase [Candidatus Xenobia bacterium]
MRPSRKGSTAEPLPPLRWPAPLVGEDLLSVADLTSDEVGFLLDLAARVKAQPARYRHALQDKTLAMLFEKPSLRTRVTFQLAIEQLGGRALYLGPEEVGLGKREAVKDVARNLSCWVDAIMARVHSHETVFHLAEYASVPVINGLSDFEHPCQALGDYMTLLEHRRHPSETLLAWVGDGNNVCHSLIAGAARTGVRMRVATPPGYEPDATVVADARRLGGNIELTHDPVAAVAGADAVYTDVWVSMGKEAEAETRRRVFLPYQVNAALMKHAGPDALFMHCLPARRGEEVTDEVLDSIHSLVCQQAENRLHIQKAILLALLA